MRVEYKEIKNATIRRLHKVVSQLRDELGEVPARFTYGDHESTVTFKLKYYGQKKALVFTVSKDEDVHTFQINYLEKTKNLIEDIDQIYIEAREPTYINLVDISRDTLRPAMKWLSEPSDRDGEIFKAPVTEYPASGVLSPDTLYYSVVKSVRSVQDVQEINPSTLTVLDVEIIEVTFASGRKRMYDLLDNQLRPSEGNLFVENYKAKYAVMSYSTARRHLDFQSKDHYAIVAQIGK